MTRRYRSVVLLLFVLAGLGTTAWAGPRIALVIGNSGYTDMPLSNPANDARLVAKTLTGLGFEVMSHVDLEQNSMKRAIQEFGNQIDAAGESAVGLFYFAGHGVQVGGENYLIPVGAAIDNERDVRIEAIPMSDVMATLDYARNELNFVILDACRNNPFARGFRSLTRGLARMDAPRGTLVAYATSPGNVALDGETANSPYTSALTDAMQQPGLPVEQMLKRVRRGVMKATNDMQVPWESSSLIGDFFFNGADTSDAGTENVPATTAGFQAIDREALFWGTIRESGDADDFREYLRQFPDGLFTALARKKIGEPTDASQVLKNTAQAQIIAPTPSVAAPASQPAPEATRARQVFQGQELEENNAIGSANRIEPNSSIKARIDPVRDVDFYKLSVRDQGALEVSISEVPPKLDVSYRMWNQEISTFTSWKGPLAAGGTTEGVVDLPHPGDYYLELRDGHDDASTRQPFQLDTRFRPTGDRHEPNNSFGDAAQVTVGDSWLSTILPVRDADWYRFRVDRHGELQVSVSDVPENLDISVRVWDAAKRAISEWFAPLARGGDTDFTFDLPAAGDYLLEVRDGHDDERSVEAYRITTRFTPSADAFEKNNDFGQAAPLAIAETIRATILPVRDADWFRLQVDEQGELTVNIHEVPENLDIVFRVWSSDASATSGWYAPLAAGGDTTHTIDLPKAGSYILELRDGRDDARSILPYQLTTTFTPTRDRAEPNDTFGTATPLKLGSPITASILPVRDADWYRISTVRPGNLKVHVGQPPANLDVCVRVWNANKSTISGWLTPRRAGGETEGEVAIPEGGVYFLEVRDGHDDNRSVATYTLTASM